MPITNLKRREIISQLQARNAPKEEIEFMTKVLDDNSPTAPHYQSLFMAQKDYTKDKSALAAEKKRVQEDHDRNMQWRQSVEMQFTQALANVQGLVKDHINKIESVKKKALTEEGVDVAEITPDARLVAFSNLSGFGGGFGLGHSTGSQPPSQPSQSSNLEGGNNNPSPPIRKDTTTMPQQNNQPQNSQPLGLTEIVTGVGSLFSLDKAHRKLFAGTDKEDLDMEQLALGALENGLTIPEYYNQLYNPQERKRELDQLSFEAKVNEEVNKRLQAERTKLDPTGKTTGFTEFTSLLDQASGSLYTQSAALANSGLPSMVGQKKEGDGLGQNTQSNGYLPPSLANSQSGMDRHKFIQEGAQTLMEELGKLVG